MMTEVLTDIKNVPKMSKHGKSFSKGRRRSRSLGGVVVNGLHETIPKKLAPQDRLEKLVELAFHHSLSTLRQEFFTKEGFNITEFRERGDKCWEKVRSDVEERSLFQLAVSDTISTSEITMFEKISPFNSAILKLETELKAWESLVSAHRIALDSVIESEPSTFHIDMNIKNDLTDYSSVLEELSLENENINSKTANLSRVFKLAIDGLKLSDKYKSYFIKKSNKHFEKSFPDTPRTVIRKLVSLCKPVTVSLSHI